MILPRCSRKTRNRLLALITFVCAARAALAAPPPNILYILTDDLGYGDVSCLNPHSAWQTPAIDRLAHEGITFTDAHSASSLCTPSRYAILTGRYAWRGRLKKGVLNGYSPPLIERGRPTVADFLRQHGYTTAMLGKWHLGLEWHLNGSDPESVDFAQPFHGGPLDHGFEHFLGLASSLDMPPYVWLDDDRAASLPSSTIGDSAAPKLWRNGVLRPDFKFEDVEPRLTERAIAFIAAHSGAANRQPFFLYVALAAPHTPLMPTREFDGKTHATIYGDFVTQVDADIGRMLAALDAAGLAKTTMVVVTSDNGFAPAAGLPEHLRIHHDPSGGFRGYKSDIFEGGHRIPFFVRWPGVAPADTRSAELIGQLDLFASCAALLGATLPPDAAEDSVNMLPVLRGEKIRQPLREALVDHSADGEFAVRQGRWKLLLCPGSGGWSPPTANPSQWLKTEAADLSLLPPFQLYDLETDPAERNNLAGIHPEIVARLGRLMRSYIERGRSTPGANQPRDTVTPWPQTKWMKSFAD